MKIKVYFLFLLVTLLVTSACGKNENTDKSWDKVKRAGELSIGIDHAFFPMSYEKNGELKGFDLDLARAVGKQLGVEVRFRPLVWTEAETKLLENKVDILWSGCTVTEKRKEAFAFSKPYLYNAKRYFIKTGSPITKPSQLKDKVVGVMVGRSKDWFEAQVEVFASVKEVKVYQTPRETLLACIGEKVDVAVVEELSGYEALNQLKISLDTLPEGFSIVAYGVMARKEDKQLIQKIDQALETLKTQEVSKEISKKWFGINLIP